MLARILGRNDEAFEFVNRALALDPLSASTHRQAAMIYWMANRLDEAAVALQAAIDISPKAGLHHGFLAIVRLLQGRGREALELAQAEGHDVFRYTSIAMVQHALGHPAESEAALRALIDGYAWTAAYQVAEVYSYRNEIDTAYEWLERAYQNRDPGVTFSANDELLRPMHSDPRWRLFMQRMGFA